MEKSEKRAVLIGYLLPIVFTLIGAAGGYCYYRFVGCTSGGCAITSDPYISTVYGGIMGLLVGFIVLPGKDAGKKAND